MKDSTLLIGLAVEALLCGVVAGHFIGKYKGMYEGALDGAEKAAKEHEEILDQLETETEKLVAGIKETKDKSLRLVEKYKKIIESEDFNEWKEMKRNFHTNKEEFWNWLKEKDEKEEKEKKEKEVKEAIKNKKWDEVYRLTERWYNHNPVDMSRAEVFTNLEKDGYITKEQNMDAHDYFGNLWFYVGD